MMLFLGLLACGSPTGAEGEAAEPSPTEQPSTDTRSAAPATARRDTHQAMVDDLAAVRHPSDGGGRVVLTAGPSRVGVGQPGTWSFRYEAGDLGIAEGGLLVFQVPAFWGWDPPQLQLPDAPGYTVVDTAAEGVVLDPQVFDRQILTVRLTGRALAAGETVELTYGAGPAGARADRFAESNSPFWFAVDGDADGTRALVDDPPRIAIGAGPPARLHLTLPSVAAPGESVRLTAAVLDREGNAGTELTGAVLLEANPALGVPDSLDLKTGGLGSLRFAPATPGVYAVAGRVGELLAVSNPMVVREGAPKVLWGDLQIHTGRSDGTGRPDEVWRYARDVAGLDVAAITDHDHWGMRFLDQAPELWEEARTGADRFDDPGQFVAIAGFEWTSWVYGHRHVLWFEDDPSLLSSMDPATDTPEELWSALKGRRALTVAHHSAGGPVAVDWSHRPPEDLEPVTEIVSVHGQSESPTAPGVIYDAVEGNFVVDQLRAGLKLGLIGSTDGHDGHPGLSHFSAPSGGLVGILAEERTRESVYEALRARRTYATNGVRSLLRFEVSGQPMGAELPAGKPHSATVRVVGTAAVDKVVEVSLHGERTLLEGADQLILHHTWEIASTAPGDFAYLRVHQEDGGLLWSSPVFFVEPTGEPAAATE